LLRFSITVLTTAVACGDDQGADPPDASEATDRAAHFTLDVPPLGDEHVYEGWAIIGGEPISTGRFTAEAEGETSPASFALTPEQVDELSSFVITIEPAVGDDPAPAATHLVAGDLDGLTATLTTSHPAALGTDFAAAAGTFLLATPSTADDTTDNGIGIWWLVPGETPAPSLTLPALPEGWSYEGWVAGASGPVTTGRFVDPGAVDSDAAGPAAGPDGGPPFPGQDFIDPAMDLDEGDVAAVITVEPEPDDDPAPFPLRPLATDPIGAATAPTAQTMSNVAAASLPSGVVVIE
jgi:hypothetical protein